MGMNAPEPVQSSGPGAESSQVGDMYAFIIAHNNIYYIPAAGYDKAYLFFELPGDGCDFSYYFPGSNFMARYFSMV